MKSITVKLLLIAVVLSVQGVANAGQVRQAAITGTTSATNGVFYVSVDTSANSQPPCALGWSLRWAIDAKTASGRVQVAQILAAKALNQKLNILGAGSCSLNSDTETANIIEAY